MMVKKRGKRPWGYYILIILSLYFIFTFFFNKVDKDCVDECSYDLEDCIYDSYEVYDNTGLNTYISTSDAEICAIDLESCINRC